MEAEDVVQEAFIQVFKRLHQFKGEATIGAWIKRITINIALNKLQKQKRIKWLGEEDIPDAQEEVPSTPPIWRVADIHEGIKTLPEGSRVVVTLHLLEGYQHQEIAQILGVSVSTSKSQYHRGKKMLQQILKKNKSSDRCGIKINT
jgi:RNA polymerase sigma-70 factor (ECF subfamily)